MTEIAHENLIIQQGVDFHWVALEAYHDGTIRNFDGWAGTFNVYADPDDFAATPVISSEAGKISAGAAAAVLTLGLQGIQVASTTLSGAHTAGDDTIAVASATGFVVGHRITVVQDEVSILLATIQAIDGTTVTLSTSLTADVVTGAAVQTWNPAYDLYNVYLHIHNSVTGGLDPWGVGSWDLDLTDPFGHEYRFWQGDACLQGGTH